VLVVEHNTELVAAADHIIDLGPEAGADGGEVVATGTPQEVAAAPASRTGHYLQRYLSAQRE
jgi:excinuclease ABC subunit A